MLLLPDELVTQIIIHSIKDELVFHFLNLRNKICGTFWCICDSDEVLLHMSLCDLHEACKNHYVRSCFEWCFREANHSEALCFEGMERLMRWQNLDKGLKLIGDVATEDSGAKYFLAMLKYRCNPADLEAMALLQEINGGPSPPDGQWKNHNLRHPRVGKKKKKRTSEGSEGITFSNPAVVGVADRVKTLAAQGSDGSFSGVREDDILTAALETPEHRGRVRGVSSSLGWGKGFSEEFTRMYRKKRNKRSNAHDMMDITFKSVVHALRLSGIDTPKNALLPSQLLAPVSSSEDEDVHGSEEEDGHDREEEHAHDSEEDGTKQDHWNANGDEANQVHSDSRYVGHNK
jgi:hypothetical protein